MQHKRMRIAMTLSGMALLIVLPVVYWANASHHWRTGALMPVNHIPFLPASAYPAGTLASLKLTILFSASLIVASMLFARLRAAVRCLVLMLAFGIVLFTLQQRLESGSIYDWSWLFVSRNQFAAFACLVFPVALTCGARYHYKAFLSGQLSSPAGCFYLAAGLLAAAVMQTGSRAGIAIVALQAVGIVFVQWRIRRRYPIVVAPPSILQRAFVCVSLALGIGFGSLALTRNYSALRDASVDFDFRQTVRADTLTMWRAQKWWGSGPGTYERVFPYYQTLPIDQFFFRHAHCEPLQFLAEYGLLGVSIMFLGVLLILAGFVGGPSPAGEPQMPPEEELEGAGLLLALGGVMLHGLVDFPLRHPVILCMTGVWLAMLIRTLRENAETLKWGKVVMPSISC
jgi:O-antigen ligase